MRVVEQGASVVTVGWDAEEAEKAKHAEELDDEEEAIIDDVHRFSQNLSHV